MTFHCPLALFQKVIQESLSKFCFPRRKYHSSLLTVQESFISLLNGRYLETLLTWNYIPWSQNPWREVHHFSTGTVFLPLPPPVLTQISPWAHVQGQASLFQGHHHLDSVIPVRLGIRSHSKTWTARPFQALFTPTRQRRKHGDRLTMAHARDQKRRSSLPGHAGCQLWFSFHGTSASTSVTPGPPSELNPVNSVCIFFSRPRPPWLMVTPFLPPNGISNCSHSHPSSG